MCCCVVIGLEGDTGGHVQAQWTCVPAEYNHSASSSSSSSSSSSLALPPPPDDSIASIALPIIGLLIVLHLLFLNDPYIKGIVHTLIVIIMVRYLSVYLQKQSREVALRRRRAALAHSDQANQ